VICDLGIDFKGFRCVVENSKACSYSKLLIFEVINTEYHQAKVDLTLHVTQKHRFYFLTICTGSYEI